MYERTLSADITMVSLETKSKIFLENCSLVLMNGCNPERVCKVASLDGAEVPGNRDLKAFEYLPFEYK